MSNNTISFLLSLSIGLTAFAGQLQPQGSPQVECYAGDVATAFQELLSSDFDPAFSAVDSFIRDEVIHGIQIDANGELLFTQISSCKFL